MNLAAVFLAVVQTVVLPQSRIERVAQGAAASAAQVDDLKLLDGTWLPVEAQLGPNKLPEEFLKTVRLVLKSGEYTSHVGEIVDRGKLKVEAAATPKTMDIIGIDGPNQGNTIPAIYEFKDGGLRVCYSIGGGARPTEFSTAGGDKYFLAMYRRESKLDPVKKLAGRWTNGAGRAEFDEHWSAAAGGAMMGMFRILQSGKPVLYEFLLIEEEEDGVFLRLRHYRPLMVDMDEMPVRAKLIEHSDERLVFSNPDPTKPVKIIYDFESSEAATATVETMRDGQPATFKFPMIRVREKVW